MKKIIFYLGLIALIFLVGCSHTDKSNTSPDVSSRVPAPGFEGIEEAIVNEEGNTGNVKEISITARQWGFDPNPIVVNKGDKVKLNIKSIDVTHGFSLPDFGINSKLNPGQTTTVEFTADKTGTFTFFCSVQCGEGHSNMKGTLIVNG